MNEKLRPHVAVDNWMGGCKLCGLAVRDPSHLKRCEATLSIGSHCEDDEQCEQEEGHEGEHTIDTGYEYVSWIEKDLTSN